jgi:hypothetical protein
MSVDLSDYVPTLRREVTPPGSTTFATVSDDVFTGYLADAFWEVRLDGFIEPFSTDPAGIVLPINDAQVIAGAADYTPTSFDPMKDISRPDIALICLYAGIKIIRNRLMEQSSKTRAKAGPVEFEQDFSANLLTEMLKELTATRNRLLFLKTYNQDVHLIDAFSARSASASSYSGYLYDWYTGAFGGNYYDMYDANGVI